MGIPWVQFSNTVPLPVNTVTVVGEGMTPYMFGYSVIPKNHAGCVWDGGGTSRRGGCVEMRRDTSKGAAAHA